MLLNLFTYLIIPLLTLDLASGYNWLTTNFSVIGSQWNRQTEFTLWGILVGGYYFFCLQAVIGRLPIGKISKSRKHLLFVTTVLALVCLVFAITTPYLPEITPFKSSLHVVFALAASAFLLIALYLTVWQLFRLCPKRYFYFFLGLILISIFCAILFLTVGIITSALEIFFTLSTGVLVNRLYGSVSYLSFCEAPEKTP